MIILYLLLISILLVIIVVLVYRNNMDISENEKKNTEKNILEARLEILEQTFKNISREIHDNIGQTLSLVKLNISTIDCEEPYVFREKMDSSKILISQAVQDLRDLSKGINTDYVLEMGMLRALEYEINLAKKTGSTEILFSIEGKPYRLQYQQELILFCIVQEILNNMLKHAGATLLHVCVNFEPHIFSLCVSNNAMQSNESFGTHSHALQEGIISRAKNRAKMINANFKLSILEKETKVTLMLPLQIQKP